MGFVTEESGKVKTLVEEVSLGSQEQTRGVEQVACAKEGAAPEELTARASKLTEVVAQLSRW